MSFMEERIPPEDAYRSPGINTGIKNARHLPGHLLSRTKEANPIPNSEAEPRTLALSQNPDPYDRGPRANPNPARGGQMFGQSGIGYHGCPRRRHEETTIHHRATAGARTIKVPRETTQQSLLFMFLAHSARNSRRHRHLCSAVRPALARVSRSIFSTTLGSHGNCISRPINRKSEGPPAVRTAPPSPSRGTLNASFSSQCTSVFI